MYYEKKMYVDNEGRELEVYYDLSGNIHQMVAVAEARLKDKSSKEFAVEIKASSIEEAFSKYDEVCEPIAEHLSACVKPEINLGSFTPNCISNVPLGVPSV